MCPPRIRRTLLIACWLALVSAPAAAAPAEPPDPQALQDEVEVLRTQVQELERARQEALAQMQQMQASLEDLQERVASVSSGGFGPTAEDRVGTTKERARRYQAERDILERRGGVLLPGGQLVVEPGIEYTEITRNRIEISGFALIPAIVVGRIDSVQVEREIFKGFLTVRYGVTDFLELEANFPYFYRKDREIFGATGAEEQDRLDAHGLGDIEAAIFAQVLRERGWVPDTILNFRVRAPTGEDPYEIDRTPGGRPKELPLGIGHWGLQPGLTFVKALDPAVLFGSISYQWNLDRDDSDFGEVDPGDMFEYDLGLAFALNERVAMSFSLQDRIVGRTEVDGEKIRRTDLNAASIFLGMSYTLSQRVGTNLTVGFGVTEDAPDFQIQLRMPLRFPKRFPVLKLPKWPWWNDDSRDNVLLQDDEFFAHAGLR
jgi:hypothetical protein